MAKRMWTSLGLDGTPVFADGYITADRSKVRHATDYTPFIGKMVTPHVPAVEGATSWVTTLRRIDGLEAPNLDESIIHTG